MPTVKWVCGWWCCVVVVVCFDGSRWRVLACAVSIGPVPINFTLEVGYILLTWYACAVSFLHMHAAVSADCSYERWLLLWTLNVFYCGESIALFHTHIAHTSQHCTQPTNKPTLTHSGLPAIPDPFQCPNFVLFPWHTAAPFSSHLFFNDCACLSFFGFCNTRLFTFWATFKPDKFFN